MTSRRFRGAAGPCVLIFAFGVGCDSDFAPYNEVDGFRLLAIAAEPPELAPGEDVRLSALVVGDDAPTFAWSWCPVTRGAADEHRCALDVDTIDGLPRGQISTATTATLEWPADVDALCDASALAEAPPAAPRLDCASERPTIQVRLEVTASNGERIIALRALPFAPRDGARNANPRIDAVHFRDDDATHPLVDAAALPSAATVPLELTIDPSAAETYAGGTREILRATWFVRGGETDVERTTFIPNDPVATFDRLTANAWTLPAAGEDVALYLVLRDDRGGASWLARRARVQGDAP